MCFPTISGPLSEYRLPIFLSDSRCPEAENGDPALSGEVVWSLHDVRDVNKIVISIMFVKRDNMRKQTPVHI